MRARALPWTNPLAAVGAAVLATWCAIGLLAAVVIGGASFPMQQDGTAEPRDAPSAFARADIPPRYLALYLQAAHAYGLDWALLAAIGKVECDHGRAPDPSCTQAGATNGAGAGGPMQFLASTWGTYGRDGNGDGTVSRWDAADAIYSAAAYLAASGARRDLPRAIFAYNHSRAYVETVERWTARYRGAVTEDTRGASGSEAGSESLSGETSTPVAFIEGARARLARTNPHVALIPDAVPLVVQAMVVAGNELQDLPYGPAGHPDPLGAPNEDCSSTTNYVLERAGIRSLGEIIRTNPVAQAYTHWGVDGPGRWVTIYATVVPTPHVFMTLAGLRLDTSHSGTDFGPNSHEDGPRWRIFDRIPGWAHWSVRHPPGL